MNNKSQNFFNNLANKWDELYYQDKESENRLDKYITYLGIKKDFKVLDLGCGTGVISIRLSELLRKRGAGVCCDFSIPMLRVAKKKIEHVNFICADAEQLPFKSGFFDTVVCFSCFPHFKNKNKVLKDISRVLKHSGNLFIGHLLSSFEIAQLHKRIKGAVKKDKMPSKKWLFVHLRQNGFKLLVLRDMKSFYLLKAQKIRADVKNN